MRFITEFEFHKNSPESTTNDLKAVCSFQIGIEIAKLFGWQVKEVGKNNGLNNERHTLEIEAFPMEKWIEFKANILNISDLDSIQYKTLIDLISELESFGKPAADTITNQKLTNDRTE